MEKIIDQKLRTSSTDSDTKSFLSLQTAFDHVKLKIQTTQNIAFLKPFIEAIAQLDKEKKPRIIRMVLSGQKIFTDVTDIPDIPIDTTKNQFILCMSDSESGNYNCFNGLCTLPQ
jgi:hypothetical protein